MATLKHIGSSPGASKLNVIFFHGLGGDLYATWRFGLDERQFWPRWLADDVAGLSVYSVGYEAAVSRWHGTAMHLTDRANNVLTTLLSDSDLETGGIAFVGHSLGGLLIKQVLRTAHSEAEQHVGAAQLLTRIEKVIFLATPHTGSDLATLGNRLRIFVRPTAATTCLVRNDPNLRDLNRWYRTWSNARKISHLTLYETEPIRILGMIVKPDSGDPGLLGPNPVAITGDHWSICKPADRDCDTYVFVRKFIASGRQKILGNEPRALPDAIVEKLLDELSERGDTKHAEKAGVSRQVIIQLAKRINAGVDEFDQALLELERAVGIAVAVAEEGRHVSNAGEVVDAALARIAEKSSKGQFDDAASEADAAFENWRCEQAEIRQSALPGGLKLLEACLRQDILRRDASSAAKRIERTAALECPDDRSAQFARLRKLQDEWYERGREKGLNFDLLVSIEAARLLIPLAVNSDDTGTAFNDLGMALYALGERESATTRLEEAVVVYRTALQHHTRENAPLSWAKTQNNLGNVLSTLGERDGGTVRLEEAIDAYRSALLERTRDRVPLDWAMTQSNLGTALGALADHDAGILHLEQAVDAYRLALEERTREKAPRAWATTQNNLGTALTALGERKGSVARLEEAVDAYGEALQEFSRDRVPLTWATLQNNLGNALRALGEQTGDAVRLKDAIDACRAALLESTRERVPLDWAATQNTLGNAHRALGELENDALRLKEGIDACRAALLESTRERVPLNWAVTQNTLGNALRAFGEQKGDREKLKEAIHACQAALLELTRERAPLDWAFVQHNLGNALRVFGQLDRSETLLEEALDTYRTALTVRTRDHFPRSYELTQQSIATTLKVLESVRAG
jgi:tetratricopeptide (TPR) repeat protein/pimeloyl-ACP methyl ester carboxylesterase